MPWLTDRVYTWVPNATAVENMFAARARKPSRGVVVRIPPTEHAAVFAMVREKRPSFQFGDFVTITRGRYIGDIGVVEGIELDGKILAIAVPARLADPTGDGPTKRPQPCLASLDWLKKTFPTEHISNKSDGSYCFRRGVYRKGYRILRISHHRVQRVFPVLHEIRHFQEHGFGFLEEVEWYVQRGDIVTVTAGPWKDVVAFVLDSFVISRQSGV